MEHVPKLCLRRNAVTDRPVLPTSTHNTQMANVISSKLVGERSETRKMYVQTCLTDARDAGEEQEGQLRPQNGRQLIAIQIDAQAELVEMVAALVVVVVGVVVLEEAVAVEVTLEMLDGVVRQISV